MNSRRRAFQSAAARRKADPFIIEIDEVEVRVRPDLDITHLDGIMSVAEQLETASAGKTQIETARAVAPMLGELRDALGACMHTGDRQAWDQAATSLDMNQLTEIAFIVIGEVTGKNPTLPSGSSDSSSTAGTTSTDGVPSEESTPSPSPSPDA